MLFKNIIRIFGVGILLGTGIWIGQNMGGSPQSRDAESLFSKQAATVTGANLPLSSSENGNNQNRKPATKVDSGANLSGNSGTQGNAKNFPPVDVNDPHVIKDFQENLAKLRTLDKENLKTSLSISAAEAQHVIDLQKIFERDIEEVARVGMMGGSQKEVDEKVIRIDTTYREGLEATLGKDKVKEYMDYQLNRAKEMERMIASTLPTGGR